MARIMVNRGPQWVQLIKGSGSGVPEAFISARHAGQVAASGNLSPHPSRPLSRMVKSCGVAAQR